jgi:putative ABC transport system ATP-binding protein
VIQAVEQLERPTQTTTVVARLRQVTHSFGRPPHVMEVLHDVELDIHARQVTLICGPSGSGKTTLLSILGLLLRPLRGSIEICGRELGRCTETQLPALRRRHVSFIFQSFQLLGALTAAENVQVGLELQGVGGRDAALGALDLLARVDLQDRAAHRPGQLSCGQQQRVAIARALASSAPLVLADEPTGNLDSESARQVSELLRRLADAENRAVVIVTHDPRLERIADRIVWLEDGSITKDIIKEDKS